MTPEPVATAPATVPSSQPILAASASPLPATTPTQTPTDAPTEQPTPLAGGWIQLGFVGPAIWAQDSLHFATAGQLGAGIYDTSGQRVKTCDVKSPSWLDESHVAGIGQLLHVGVVCDINSAVPTSVPLSAAGEYAVGNGHGAVAFDWPHSPSDENDASYDFAVWGGDALSAPQHAFAQAWSPDGSRLAVLDVGDGGRDPVGVPSLLSWPGLQVSFASESLQPAVDLTFDPSGRYIGYLTDGASNLPDWIEVADTRTGSVADLPRDLSGNFYWTADSLISVVTRDGVRSRYRPDGTLVSTWAAPFLWSATTPDSATVAFWDADRKQPNLRIETNGRTEALQAPDKVDNVSIAPDGSALVVSVVGNASYLHRP
jgi:hypothetical protein